MSRALVLSVVVASLSMIVGCGASRSAPQVASPADAPDPACWTPPTEIAMSFKEPAKAEPAATTTTTSTEPMTGSYRPNLRERPTAGAIHAAH